MGGEPGIVQIVAEQVVAWAALARVAVLLRDTRRGGEGI